LGERGQRAKKIIEIKTGSFDLSKFNWSDSLTYKKPLFGRKL
jgi:hypothetical protein